MLLSGVTYFVVVGDFKGDGVSDLASASTLAVGGAGVTVSLSQPFQVATATGTGIAPLGSGTHQVEASYPGDSLYGASTSATISLTAQQANPSVTVTPSSLSVTTAQAFLVAVAVSGGAGNPTPTGTVVLTSGAYTPAATALNGGSATITVPAGSQAAGTDTLTASYSGDANYLAATGTSSIKVTVPPPTFAVTGTAVSIAPGATTGNTSTLSVTPSGGFTGSVTLTAAVTASPSGAIDPPTASFGATTPISITTAAAGTATLTITTTAPSSSTCVSAYQQRRGLPWYASGGGVLACVFLLWIPGRRRFWRTMLGMFALLIAFTSGVLACGGGGGGSTNCPGPISSGTTAGAYTITVTGTSGSITQTGTVTLTVQ